MCLSKALSGFDKDIKESLKELENASEKLQSIQDKNRELLACQKTVEEKEKSISFLEQKIERLLTLVEKHKNSDMKSLQNQLKELEEKSKLKIEEMESLTNLLNKRKDSFFKHFGENVDSSKVMSTPKLNTLSCEIEEKLKMFDNELKQEVETREAYLKEIQRLNKKG